MWAGHLEGKKVRDRKFHSFYIPFSLHSGVFCFQQFRRHSNKLIFQFARSPCHISPKGYHVSPLNRVTRYRSRSCCYCAQQRQIEWKIWKCLEGCLHSHLGYNQLVHIEILQFQCISTWSSAAAPHPLPPRHDIRSCLAMYSNQFKHTKCNL